MFLRNGRRSEVYVARSYGQKFLLELTQNDDSLLGVQLARLCVDANLPAAYVARALEVSSMTVYKWFRGMGVRENKRRAIEVFMYLVRQDMEAGLLPATNTASAKEYIRNMIGV
jgi:hypothetical protein